MFDAPVLGTFLPHLDVSGEPSGARRSARRRWLRSCARSVTGALALGVLGGCQSRAGTADAGVQLAMASLPADDVGLLNYVLTAEYEVIAGYQTAAASGLVTHPVLDAANAFESDHRRHAERLVSTVARAGGGAVKIRSVGDYGFPVGTFRTQSDVLRFLAAKEKKSADAYLAVIPQFTSRDLARTAASILGTETMHWAVLLGTLGENAVPSPFLS